MMRYGSTVTRKATRKERPDLPPKHADGSLAPLAGLSDVAIIKVLLMSGIDQVIRSQYATLKDAAIAAGVNTQQLSRLRHGRHEGLSVPWLLRLADRFGVTLTIGLAIPG